MATRKIGYFALINLVKRIARHCNDNDGSIHDTDLDRYINNLRNSSECYSKASITDLFTALGDRSHDMIEREHGEYWKLTEYAHKCITPKKWIS